MFAKDGGYVTVQAGTTNDNEEEGGPSTLNVHDLVHKAEFEATSPCGDSQEAQRLSGTEAQRLRAAETHRRIGT